MFLVNKTQKGHTFKMKIEKRGLIFQLFLLSFFIAILYLGYQRCLCETLEAESAETAREFLQNGFNLINHLNGQPDFDKPPLYYWTISLFSIFSPNWELAARLPSILSLVIIIFLIKKFLNKKEKEGFYLATFFLLACPKIFWMGQIARMDLYLTAICFLSLFLFLKSLENKTFLPWLFFFTGVTALIKGPVGPFLVFATAVLYLLLSKKAFLLKKTFFSPWIAVFFLIALPWYIYATLSTNFEFFHHFFLKENLSRFTSLYGLSFKTFNHSPPTRYISYFFFGFFPWSIFAPFWLVDTIKNWTRKDDTQKLLFCFFSFVFIFFTLAQSKRSDYILPLYPAAAILTSRFLLDKKRTELFISLNILIAILIGVIGSVLSYAYFNEEILLNSLNLFPREKIAFVFRVIEEDLFIFILLTIIMIFSTIFLFKKRNHGLTEQLQISLTMFSLIFLFMGLEILPKFYSGYDVRPFCQRIRPSLGKEEVYFLGKWDEATCFYLNRYIYSKNPNSYLQNQQGQKGLFITDEKGIKWLKGKGLNPKILIGHIPPLSPRFLIKDVK